MRMDGSGIRRRLAMVALFVLSPLTVRAQSQGPGGPTSAMDDEWHFTLAPYMWMSGIKGDVSAADRVTIPVDASFADILDNFDFGLEGHFEARKNRLGFAFDFIWTDLGVPAADTRVGQLNVDVRQFITEGFVFYRAAHGGRADNPAHLDLLVGGRYTGTRSRLTGESNAGIEYDGEFQDLDWFDAMAGLQFRAPLGSRLAVLGRADVAGFGSNVTWNFEGDLAFLASEHWSLGAGWRYLSIDYDNGEEGIGFRQFDLAYSGPRVWFAYSW